MVKLKYMSIYRKLHISFKMKKFILFHLSLITVIVMCLGCFNNIKKSFSSMLILKSLNCQNCHDEIEGILSSYSGLIDYSIAVSNNEENNDSFIIVLIEHKNQFQMSSFKKNLTEKGYIIDE